MGVNVGREGFFSDGDAFEIVLRLAASLIVGGFIGIERSYHGRPAGFRTHALVCLSTSMLMLIGVYEEHWLPDFARGRITLDPTRIVQGIMTGIGFLGAGSIIKEGLSVRGLTTAASVWVTAAIGILIGVGFYFPAGIATVLTVVVLSFFRLLEDWIPTQLYAQFNVRFKRDEVMPEKDVRGLLDHHGFVVVELDYSLDANTNLFDYGMILQTKEADNAGRLTETLKRNASVKGFHLALIGD
jgi:putative Mg2+ transporter-C (MgtC) family protein